MVERTKDLGNASDLDSLQQDMEAFRPGSEPQRLERTHALTVPAPAARPQPEDTLLGLLAGGILSIAAGGLAFAVVAGIVLAIIVPPWYRSLEPRYQVIWCNRISLLCHLKPERPEDDVYRLIGDDAQVDSALALLATETPTPEPAVPPTSTAVPTEPVATIAAASATPTSPSPTATPTPTLTPTPTPLPLPAAASLQLERLRWEQQKWNNCGPTTVTIGLTYFGYRDDQQRAARFLKPNVEDTNVSPDQLVAFVNSLDELGTLALYRVGGTPALLKRLLANDFPVIIERGIQVENEGWMGHYSLLVGYDSATEEYLFFDSYLGFARGTGRRFKFDTIHESWRQFNYTFVVLYLNSRDSELMRLLGDEYATLTSSANIALGIARAEATANPDDKWAWFNMGSSLTLLGNYGQAAQAYDYSRTLNLPFRMLWYQFGPYVAYYQVGRYDDVLALALASEKTTPYIEETYYYRGLVYAAQGNANSAIFQFDRALSYNANFTKAADAKQAVLEGRSVTIN
jgi:tetratricopeptide (TPR) repeat protein